jgi:hypothetical protein
VRDQDNPVPAFTPCGSQKFDPAGLARFEAFRATKRDGMGLGPTICRSIAKAHGGELRYEPNLGGGTIFRFTPRFRPMAAERVVYAGRLLHLQPCSACAAPSPDRLNPRSPSIRARL